MHLAARRQRARRRHAEPHATILTGRMPTTIFACVELYNACVEGRLEGALGVRQLITVQKREAALDVLVPILVDDETGDEYETTALLGAVVAGQLGAMRLLLVHGADPNLPDSDGTTPLMAAASCGLLIAVEELVARGAKLDARHPRGSTAFHEACIANEPECAALLVTLGCNRMLRTNNGSTGEQIAAEDGHLEVIAAVARAKEQAANTKRRPARGGKIRRSAQ